MAYAAVVIRGKTPKDPTPRNGLGQIRRWLRALRRWETLKGSDPRHACTRAAKEAGVHPRTLKRWRKRLEAVEGDLNALRDQSRRPHHITYPFSQELRMVVITMRLLTGWGAQRIAAECRARKISTVSHQTVHNWLRQVAAFRPPEPKAEHNKRYERKHPNELWHIDVKGPFYIRGVGKTYILGVVDDYSRYIIACQVKPDHSMEAAIQFLQENIEVVGSPDALMSDNGREFVHRITGLINGFQKLLQERGIRHIRTKINSPVTNGKIELFWRTLKEEVLEKEWFESLEEAQAAINSYVKQYNHHRLHKGIGYKKKHRPAATWVPLIPIRVLRTSRSRNTYKDGCKRYYLLLSEHPLTGRKISSSDLDKCGLILY
jgi:transposase InsO family protein